MFRIVLSLLVALGTNLVAGRAVATECTAAFCLPSAVSQFQSTTLFVPQQAIAVQSLAVPSVAVQQSTTPLVIQQVTPLAVKQHTLAVVQQVEPVVIVQKVVRTTAIRAKVCHSRRQVFGRGLRCR